MTEEQKIPSGEDCLICGSELIIHTTADQREAEKAETTWWAWDGDKAVCPDCGGIGNVEVEGDCYGSLSFDEESDHNTACWKKYEATK